MNRLRTFLTVIEAVYRIERNTAREDRANDVITSDINGTVITNTNGTITTNINGIITTRIETAKNKTDDPTENDRTTLLVIHKNCNKSTKPYLNNNHIAFLAYTSIFEFNCRTCNKQIEYSEIVSFIKGVVDEFKRIKEIQKSIETNSDIINLYRNKNLRIFVLNLIHKIISISSVEFFLVSLGLSKDDFEHLLMYICTEMVTVGKISIGVSIKECISRYLTSKIKLVINNWDLVEPNYLKCIRNIEQDIKLVYLCCKSRDLTQPIDKSSEIKYMVLTKDCDYEIKCDMSNTMHVYKVINQRIEKLNLIFNSELPESSLISGFVCIHLIRIMDENSYLPLDTSTQISDLVLRMIGAGCNANDQMIRKCASSLEKFNENKKTLNTQVFNRVFNCDCKSSKHDSFLIGCESIAKDYVDYYGNCLYKKLKELFSVLKPYFSDEYDYRPGYENYMGKNEVSDRLNYLLNKIVQLYIEKETKHKKPAGNRCNEIVWLSSVNQKEKSSGQASFLTTISNLLDLFKSYRFTKMIALKTENFLKVYFKNAVIYDLIRCISNVHLVDKEDIYLIIFDSTKNLGSYSVFDTFVMVVREIESPISKIAILVEMFENGMFKMESYALFVGFFKKQDVCLYSSGNVMPVLRYSNVMKDNMFKKQQSIKINIFCLEYLRGLMIYLIKCFESGFIVKYDAVISKIPVSDTETVVGYFRNFRYNLNLYLSLFGDLRDMFNSVDSCYFNCHDLDTVVYGLNVYLSSFISSNRDLLINELHKVDNLSDNLSDSCSDVSDSCSDSCSVVSDGNTIVAISDSDSDETVIAKTVPDNKGGGTANNNGCNGDKNRGTTLRYDSLKSEISLLESLLNCKMKKPIEYRDYNTIVRGLLEFSKETSNTWLSKYGFGSIKVILRNQIRFYFEGDNPVKLCGVNESPSILDFPEMSKLPKNHKVYKLVSYGAKLLLSSRIQLIDVYREYLKKNKNFVPFLILIKFKMICDIWFTTVSPGWYEEGAASRREENRRYKEGGAKGDVKYYKSKDSNYNLILDTIFNFSKVNGREILSKFESVDDFRRQMLRFVKFFNSDNFYNGIYIFSGEIREKMLVELCRLLSFFVNFRRGSSMLDERLNHFEYLEGFNWLFPANEVSYEYLLGYDDDCL